MKTLLYPFSLLFMLSVLSCQSKDDNVTSSQITGKWKLTKIVYTSMIAGQPDTSTAPLYEEVIELKADSTFRRYRSNGYEATGTYTTKAYTADEYGILVIFDNKELSYHELPGSKQYSFTKGQVFLRQQEPGIFVESYTAADGPSFYYQKVKEQK